MTFPDRIYRINLNKKNRKRSKVQLVLTSVSLPIFIQYDSKQDDINPVFGNLSKPFSRFPETNYIV